MSKHRVLWRILQDNIACWFGEPVWIKRYAWCVTGSHRTYRSGDKFLVCTSCRWSTRLCKKIQTNPPKHLIANGFVIGHIPWYPKVHYPTNYLPNKLHLRVEYGHGIQTLNESDIEFSYVFLSVHYKYVFGFTGGMKRNLGEISQ
jgi:hypothetical protein